MNQDKVKELIEEVGTDISGKWIGVDNAEKLIHLVVSDCINTIENTPFVAHSAFTTYDMGVVNATIEKNANAIKNKYGIKNNRGHNT